MTINTPPFVDEPSARDEELDMAVRDALGSYGPFRMWGDKIELETRQGVVTLSGIVRSHSAKEIAEQVVRRVPGVKSVENRLVADADVESAIAQALASDPRTGTSFPGILVGVVFGVVYLKGTVATAEVKAAAGQIALGVPGVQSVSNELLTLPELTPAVQTGAPGKPQAAVKPVA